MFKNKANDKKPLLSIMLVIFESLIALLLKFDKPLKRRLVPLVEENLVVCVRTYLPHYVFYVSFTQEGVLLDKKLPDQVKEEDVLISAAALSLFRILLTGDENLLAKLQFRGENTEIDLLKDCLSNLGLQNISRDLVNNLKDFSPEVAASNRKAISQFESQVSLQEQTIDELEKSLTASRSQSVNLQKQIRFLLGMVVFLLVTLVVITVVYLFS